jgi:hypothetical protein
MIRKYFLLLLSFGILDGLIGMATASCVIGVTILKSQDVRDNRFFDKLIHVFL